MITRRTKVQLLVFAIITLVGVSFVGARYARLDRLVVDDSYTVVAHFQDSGGIFTAAEVTYRGVQVGQVEDMDLTEDGVDVHLAIDEEYDSIPADTLAVVGNRSAVGEQYVELQPQSDEEPYLGDGSEVEQADTRTPIATETLLSNLSTTVESVDKQALATTLEELGAAFAGTGEDLQRIIDTGNSFIETANANFDTTTALIRESNTVLKGQIRDESALRTFASQLSLFSGTLAASDPALRGVIGNGGVAATELQTFLQENRVELGDLINNLVTTGNVTVKHLDGIEQILVLYPYVVEGGFTVVSKSPGTGLYDAHFGLIITDHHACRAGYEDTDRRPPQDGSNRPMNEKAGCTEPPTQSNSRGPQNLRKRAPADYRAPVVATYDAATGEVEWTAQDAAVQEGLLAGGTGGAAGSVAPAALGEESWKWLFLQPLLTQE